MFGDLVLLCLKVGLNILLLLLTVDYSCMTWLYFMKSSSELFFHFSSFYTEMQTQFNVPIQILRNDHVKKYLSESFQTYMTQHGILRQTSCVDTPSQNMVVERKNRHLLETGRALFFQMHVPKRFWADEVSQLAF